MALELIAKHRENAEVYKGADMCKEKFWEIMESLKLPKGLVPLDDEVTELGHNKITKFLWLIRNNKKEHVYKGITGKVYFDTVLAAFVEVGKMKQMHGVKAKELFLTVTLREMYMTDPASDKISFTTAVGITKAQPRSHLNLKIRDEK